jgi:hypothetical protein
MKFCHVASPACNAWRRDAIVSAAGNAYLFPHRTNNGIQGLLIWLS